VGDVLARETAGEHVDRLEVSIHVAHVGHHQKIRRVPFDDGAAVSVRLARPDGSQASALKPEVESEAAGEQRSDIHAPSSPLSRCR
jgi:hypothetical protein